MEKLTREEVERIQRANSKEYVKIMVDSILESMGKFETLPEIKEICNDKNLNDIEKVVYCLNREMGCIQMSICTLLMQLQVTLFSKRNELYARFKDGSKMKLDMVIFPELLLSAQDFGGILNIKESDA